MTELWTKNFLLSDILAGRKTLEVRVKEGDVGRVRAGERIVLKSESRRVSVRVDDVREYRTFDAMLGTEPYTAIASAARSNGHVLGELRRIYSREREAKGVVVFQISDPTAA